MRRIRFCALVLNIEEFATESAFCWMNSRRGSTTSPMSFEKISSASFSSPSFTCMSVRDIRIERGLAELPGVHLAKAFVALHGEPGPPCREDRIEEAARSKHRRLKAFRSSVDLAVEKSGENSA